MELKSLIRKYLAFMTHPVSPVPLSTFRTVFGTIVTLNAFFLFPDINVWFSNNGVLPASVAQQVFGLNRLSLFSIFGSSVAVVSAVFVVHVFAAVFLTVGLFTRSSSVVLFLTLVSFHQRNIYILHSGDTLMRLMSFFMMFANAGAAYSIDRLIKVFRGRIGPFEIEKVYPAAQRLMQLQLCIVYASTFAWKSLGNMWVNGSAVYVVNQIGQFDRFPIPAVLKSQGASRFLTWYTLAVELTFPVLIWFKETRLLIMACIFALHLGLEYTMNIQLFQPMICSVFILFLTKQELSRAFEFLVGLTRKPFAKYRTTVFYDGQCGFCKQCVFTLQCLDIFNLLKWVDSRAVETEAEFPEFSAARAEVEILTLNEVGQWHGGFFAMRALGLRLPMLIIPALFGYLPLVPTIGTFIYAKIAKNRSRISSVLMGSSGCALNAPVSKKVS